MDPGDKDMMCLICKDPPHNAVLLHCWTKKAQEDGSSSRNEKCKPILCGTSKRRSNCINKFLSFWGHKGKYPFARWSEHAGRLEFLDDRSPTSNWTFLECPLCRGPIRGAQAMPAAHREYFNSLHKKCDFNKQDCNFDFKGNHDMIEAHIAQVHAPPLAQEEEDAWEI